MAGKILATAHCPYRPYVPVSSPAPERARFLPAKLDLKPGANRYEWNKAMIYFTEPSALARCSS